MKHIEHIGIAVNDLKESNQLFERLLGVAPYKEEVVESQGVRTSFFKTSINKIELLEPTDDRSSIAKYLEKRGEGVHHIAFAVDDIETELERLNANGFKLIHSSPIKGADNKLVAFLHPKGTSGVLIELCQAIS